MASDGMVRTMFHQVIVADPEIGEVGHPFNKVSRL
jgi:hypothetical protein